MDVSGLKIERTPKAAARNKRGNPWFTRLVALGMLATLIWLFRAPLLSFVDRVRLPQVNVMQVVESHPAAAGAVRGTAANGHVVAARRAALSADTPGRIVELNVTEGSVVKKGDVVARLYADEYAAALRQAKAELAAAEVDVRRGQAAVEQAKAEREQLRKNAEASAEGVREAAASHDLAVIEHRRATDLVARGVRAQSSLDTAQRNLDGSAAQLRTTEAQHRAADAAVLAGERRVLTAMVDTEAARARLAPLSAAIELAQATLAKTEVRAPFDGIVVLKDAEIGEVVSPNSQGGSNARGSVCTMVDRASLEAQAEVPETSLGGVRIGGAARVYLDAFPDRAYEARVDRVWPTANRQKATVEVRARFLDPDEALRPEMGLRIVFLADEAEAAEATTETAILVPFEAVVRVEDRDGVFLLERDAVQFRAVELGPRRGGRVAVRSGLEPGQRIVTDPPLNLRSGDRVRPGS